MTSFGFLSVTIILSLLMASCSDQKINSSFCNAIVQKGELSSQLNKKFENVGNELALGRGSNNRGIPLWNDGSQGATFQYYHKGAMQPWVKPSGDWVDANGEKNGNEPFGSVNIHRSIENNRVSIDLTNLILKIVNGEVQNEGFFLLTTGKTVSVASKENSNKKEQAKLTINTETRIINLDVVMDTHISTSTVNSSGHKTYLKISRSSPGLLWFDLSGIKNKADKILSAQLSLHVNKLYSSKPSQLNVFLVNSSSAAINSNINETGIASEYMYDCGIEKDPRVFYATDFEEPSWKKSWHERGAFGKVVEEDYDAKFKPLLGKALDVSLQENQYKGVNQRLKFEQLIGKEPEEAYFRYYIRVGDDWNNTTSGGKFPGFSGTYNRAGWGGRGANGFNGWSTRGKFLLIVKDEFNKELNDTVPIGTYAYHADQGDRYGDNWMWNRNGNIGIKKNRWYSIEQHVKLNTPGKNDGVLRAWIDGRLVFKKRDIRYRDTSDLKIEEVWFNVYHGGTKTSPKHQSLFIDNIVVSSSYIGPLNFHK